MEEESNNGVFSELHIYCTACRAPTLTEKSKGASLCLAPSQDKDWMYSLPSDPKHGVGIPSQQIHHRAGQSGRRPTAYFYSPLGWLFHRPSQNHWVGASSGPFQEKRKSRRSPRKTRGEGGERAQNWRCGLWHVVSPSPHFLWLFFRAYREKEDKTSAGGE